MLNIRKRSVRVYMKMKVKMLLLAIIPLILFGATTVLLSNSRVSEVVTDSIENGLRGAVISVHSTLQYAGEGSFYTDENGNLFKGDFNITEHTDIADSIKKSTDMDITIFYGDTRYMTSVCDESGNRVVGTQAGDAVIEKVLRGGEEYFATNVDVVGQPFYGYYMPLYDTETNEIVGMIFAGMPQADAQREIFAVIAIIGCVMIILLILCSIILFLIVGRMVLGLRHCVEILDRVSSGKLNVKVDSKMLTFKDEVGTIARAVQKLQEDLQRAISNVKNQSVALVETADGLSDKSDLSADHVQQVEKAIEEIALGAGNQAEETQDATENIILMGNMIEETTEDIEALNQNAKSIKDRGEIAVGALKELQEINELAKGSINVIYDQTNVTNESAQKIQEAIAIITEIAEETNLLSLNASIEAARAGEQGRGFAVVAAQIQKLAEQSNESARQIESIILSLMEDSEKAVNTMNEVQGIMEKQSQKVSNTDTQVGEVLQEVEQAIKAISNVASKTEKINATRGNVVDTVQNLSAIAEENAASTEETSAAAVEVSNIITDIADNAKSLKEISQLIEESMSIFEI